MSLTFKYCLFTKQFTDLVVLKIHARLGLATDNTPHLHSCFVNLTWDHFQNSRTRQESHSQMPGTQPVSQRWVNMTHKQWVRAIFGSWVYKTSNKMYSLFSLSPFLSVSPSLSLSISLSLWSIKLHFFEGNMGALTSWVQSLLESSLGSREVTLRPFSGMALHVESTGCHWWCFRCERQQLCSCFLKGKIQVWWSIC